MKAWPVEVVAVEQPFRRSRLTMSKETLLVAIAIVLAFSAVISMWSTVQSTSAVLSSSRPVNSNAFTAKADWVAPVVSSAAMVNSLGNLGVLKQGGTYQVCAGASDSGAPASGISSISANMAVTGSVVSTGQNAAAASAGTFTCGGISYGYRTGTLTANASLSGGSKTFNMTGVDAAGNSATTSWSLTVDNTAPTSSGFRTINKAGGTTGTAEIGDQLVLTYTESLHPGSIKSSWDGTSTQISVTVNNNVAGFGNNDTMTFSANLGTINLGANNYTGAQNSVFAGTMLWGDSPKTITVTLNTLVTNNITRGSSSTATYVPNSAISDLAGNVISTTVQPTEAGKRHF